MPASCVTVARGLLLYGQHISDGALTRKDLLHEIGDIRDTTFRSNGEEIGAIANRPGLRFFESSPNKIAFGPGAGLVLGVSLGTSSLRAALFDANGWMYHEHESRARADQLSLSPPAMLDRICAAAQHVLQRARLDAGLCVDNRFPFLGVAVAWPTPLDRDKKPVGPALTDDLWRRGSTLTQRVATALDIPPERSHALNDTQAAAIAVAYDRTRRADHLKQPHAEVAIVVRLSAAVGAATIIVEPPDLDGGQYGRTSGFLRSTLLTGRDGHAGELGHVGLDPSVIASRNKNLPPGLGQLRAGPCSCAAQPRSRHLEAYASAAALARRVAPDGSIGNAIHGIVSEPTHGVHQRALEDIGALVGHALVGPVTVMNPSTITLTGSLAVPVVARALGQHLSDAQVFGTAPEIRLIAGSENTFVRARGAALAVIRGSVHRHLRQLLAGRKDEVASRLREAVIDVPSSLR